MHRLVTTVLLFSCFYLRAAENFPDFAQLPARSLLPDPLLMQNGDRVTSERQWKDKRRPELKALFEHYMYGKMPPAPRGMKFEVKRIDTNYFGGKATIKEVTIKFKDTSAPSIHLMLVVPNNKKAPAPTFLALNFCGNHTIVTNRDIRLPTETLPKTCPGCVDRKATDAGRGAQAASWALEKTIERGYALATFFNGDIEPDDVEATHGIRSVYRSQGYDFGAIAAWAWGLQRAVDYLLTDKDVDGQKIAVMGHSRNGKAAIVAAAFDDRIAMAIPVQAGCGGTSPSRGKVGESVKAINDRFPHWFNAEFKEFNSEPERLPFDQNCLIALCAPRPVLLSNATEDTWSNPAGQFEMLQSADAVYRLLHVEGFNATAMPETNHLVASRLGYFIRPGKHSVTPVDWQAILDFADAQWKH